MGSGTMLDGTTNYEVRIWGCREWQLDKTRRRCRDNFWINNGYSGARGQINCTFAAKAVEKASIWRPLTADSFSAAKVNRLNVFFERTIFSDVCWRLANIILNLCIRIQIHHLFKLPWPAQRTETLRESSSTVPCQSRFWGLGAGGWEVSVNPRLSSLFVLPVTCARIAWNVLVITK